METLHLTNNSWLSVAPRVISFSKHDFEQLWNQKPTKKHTIKVYNKVIEVPRT